MGRIEIKFKELRQAKKKAFIAFITAGYPDLETTRRLLCEFDRIGVDIVELGVPFSDPLADGPVIQEASQAALKKKTNLAGILKMVGRVRAGVSVPICLMTYYNPVFRFGEKRFIKEARAAGVDGIIIPDLPPEEGRTLMRLAAGAGIAVICFVSPTTQISRMKYITGAGTGFIYYVSLTGVTGARRELPPDLRRNLALVKAMTDKPVCAGFGVSTPEQVKEIGKTADGVIVGSAIVARIRENIGRPDLVERVAKFVRQLKG